MRRTLPLGVGLALALAACDSQSHGPIEMVDVADEAAVDIAPNPSPDSWGTIPPLDVSGWELPLRRSSDVIATAATLTPPLLVATLNPGETISEDKTADLPGGTPVGDVVFAFDLTASMGGELKNVRNNSLDILAEISGVIGDVQFGVVSHQDYPAVLRSTPEIGGCNYYQRYGERTDRPYRLHQRVTDIDTDVVSAIGKLRLGSGADGPESYSRVFYESYAELEGTPSRRFGSIGWRDGAKKILVAFGDNIPHDCNYNAILGGVSDSGVDPGRDAVVGTGDDLRILDVLDGMARNGVTLIHLYSGENKFAGLWDAYAARTGGTSFQINPDGSFPTLSPAEQIAELISDEVSHYDEVALRTCMGDESFDPWVVDVSPASYKDVDVPDVFDFDLTVGPPAGTAAGFYAFSMCVFGDGVELARQGVNITVPDDPGVLAGIDVDPAFLTFTADEGTNPPTQDVTVTNTGPAGATLNWTATVDQPWLSVSPASGSMDGGLDQDFTVTVTSATLARGMYTANITVADPAAVGSPVVIPVGLTVTMGDDPIPAIGLDKHSLMFTKAGSAPPDRHVEVDNVGEAGSTLHWMAIVPLSAPWLKVSPPSGSVVEGHAPSDLTVSVDCTGLAPGAYSTTITITDPFASNDPQVVDVDLVVTDTPDCLDILGILELLIMDYEDDGIIPGYAETAMLGWIAEARHQMLVGGAEGPNPHAAAQEIFMLIRFLENAVLDGRISEEDAQPLLDLAHEFLECIGIPFPPPQPPEEWCGPILDLLDDLIDAGGEDGFLPNHIVDELHGYVRTSRNHLEAGELGEAVAPMQSLIDVIQGGLDAGHLDPEEAEPFLTEAAHFIDCVGGPPRPPETCEPGGGGGEGADTDEGGGSCPPPGADA